jgi:hypothetical protein
MKVEHDTVAELSKGLIKNRLLASKRHCTAVNTYVLSCELNSLLAVIWSKAGSRYRLGLNL